VRLVSLTKAMAVLDIAFLGDVPHFQRSLAQQDLALDVQGPNKGLLRQDSSAHSGGLPEPAPMPAPAPTDDSYLAPSEPTAPAQPAVPQ
jgi:hypothetical protein